MQTMDLEQNIRSTCQKIVDMSDAYQELIDHTEDQLGDALTHREDLKDNLKTEQELWQD